MDREAEHYCEQEHLNERYILAPSVLRIDFTEPYAGYLTAQPFTHIESLLSDKTEYFIQTYEEDENEVTQQVQKQCKLVLLKKISIGPEWCEIYKVVR